MRAVDDPDDGSGNGEEEEEDDDEKGGPKTAGATAAAAVAAFHGCSWAVERASGTVVKLAFGWREFLVCSSGGDGGGCWPGCWIYSICHNIILL